MPITTEPLEASITRARLRVLTLVSMLRAHRALESPRSHHWQTRERELIRRLAEAQVDLEHLELAAVA
jgi:hypothetical protein